MTETRLVMPPRVLVEAVKLAEGPCDIGCQGWTLTEHPAVKYLTDWWNSAATPDVRNAYGVSLYVQHGEDWLSGDPEEGLVDADTFAKSIKPRAEALLLDGRAVFIFLTESVDEDEHSFYSKAVDGSHGLSGGKWPEISGNGIVTFYSYKQLSIIPIRFPELWNEVCKIG